MHQSLGWPAQYGWGPRDCWDRDPTPKEVVSTEEFLIRHIKLTRQRELQRHAKKMSAIAEAEGIVQRRQDDRMSAARIRAEAERVGEYTAEDLHRMFVADLEVI